MAPFESLETTNHASIEGAIVEALEQQEVDLDPEMPGEDEETEEAEEDAAENDDAEA